MTKVCKKCDGDMNITSLKVKRRRNETKNMSAKYFFQNVIIYCMKMNRF